MNRCISKACIRTTRQAGDGIHPRLRLLRHVYEEPLKDCGWALRDYLDGSNDSVDADAILQFWLFFEVMFG